MSAMKLCRLYRQHRITRKVITHWKGCSESKIDEYLEWQDDSWNAIAQAHKLNQRIVYIDEVVFTKATVPRCEYATLGNNICINENDFYHRYLAVVAAISADRGVDAIMIFDQAVNKEMFVDFLTKLHK